jgi:RES domain-containing protein
LQLFTLLIPDEVTAYPVETLPAYWDEQSYERTQWILRDWLTSPTTLAAAVPSVVVPMSYNYLLHPAHPGFKAIEIVKQEPFPIERRLWRDDAPSIDSE